MPTIYRIHPGIGIARLGNSPEGFCISPEKPAALPLDCDADGNPLLSPDGMTELPVTKFKDNEGRLKRQAARFQVWVYDEQSPEGRPLKLGDPVEGGGNQGVLVDIQWLVYLANKKASWYQFQQLAGEHGYADDHPRRNATITDPEARQRLIIDPGPRFVDCKSRRRDRCDRNGGDVYAATFPPALEPRSIDTLGEIFTDNTGRLLVLGGHGHSGTFRYGDFGQPRIDTYANNDGWFDDTSDGPVMARLVMFSSDVNRLRFIDVEYPAWVVAGYPAYAPEILDMVTASEVIEDMGVREFATHPEIYGTAGAFDCPQRIDPADRESLALWQAGRLQWNPDYKPWFYRDIWTILYRPDQFSYLSSVLGLSNYPHNQSSRGNFDPEKLSVPPIVNHAAVKLCEMACVAKNQSGELFIETLFPLLAMVENQAVAELAEADQARGWLTGEFARAMQSPVAQFAQRNVAATRGGDVDAYARAWSAAPHTASEHAHAKNGLEQAIEDLLENVRNRVSSAVWKKLRVAVFEHLNKFHTGQLLEECRRKCVAAHTYDPYGALRRYLYEVLREPGEENRFRSGGRADSRVHGLPLMPLLAGDNPISNEIPSKFLRLTDLQLYLLRQWARGCFHNEKLRRWSDPDPWAPYQGWVNRTGRDLDRGVLSNLLGGAFCPGGEIGWVLRNPAAYREPFRIKADPRFSQFQQTAAQANANAGTISNAAFAAYLAGTLSQDNNFDVGLQPGDLTKYMALPWQADFNECYTQNIDVTYSEWNKIASSGDAWQAREQKVWETLWWPAHRPIQVFELQGMVNGQPVINWQDWARGVPQNKAGDLKMVTEWSRLSIVVRNPFLGPGPILPTDNPPDQKYIGVERTEPTARQHEKEAP